MAKHVFKCNQVTFQYVIAKVDYLLAVNRFLEVFIFVSTYCYLILSFPLIGRIHVLSTAMENYMIIFPFAVLHVYVGNKVKNYATEKYPNI